MGRAKELLLASHDAFLSLIAPGLIWVDKLSEELPAGARRADLAWLVEDGEGQRLILHIELQMKLETGKDKDIRERMAEYALRLIRRDHLPIYSILIFLKPVATPEPFLDRHGTARACASTLRLSACGNSGQKSS